MNYLKHNYKRMFMPLVSLTVIGVVIFTLPLLTVSVDKGSSYQYDSNITALAFYFIVVAIFIAVYEFSPLKNKRGADLYYGLPLNKKQLYTQFYVKGLLEIVISYSITFILGLAVTLLKGYDFNYLYYLPLFFMLLIAIIAYYTFNVFLFLRSNRTIDGVLFIILYIAVAFAVYAVGIHLFGFKGEPFTPFQPITAISSFYKQQIEGYEYFELLSHSLGLKMSVGWLLLSGLLGVFALCYPKYDRPENIQQISNSWIGYKVIIPILLFSVIFVMSFGTFAFVLVSSLMYTVVAYIGYVIYERTFKISLTSLIVLLSTTVAGLTFYYLFNLISQLSA